MANKFSKTNNSTRAREEKTMQDYRDRQSRINKGAKIMAILLIASMVFFYVISAGFSFLD